MKVERVVSVCETEREEGREASSMFELVSAPAPWRSYAGGFEESGSWQWGDSPLPGLPGAGPQTGSLEL